LRKSFGFAVEVLIVVKLGAATIEICVLPELYCFMGSVIELANRKFVKKLSSKQELFF